MRGGKGKEAGSNDEVSRTRRKCGMWMGMRRVERIVVRSNPTATGSGFNRDSLNQSTAFFSLKSTFCNTPLFS